MARRLLREYNELQKQQEKDLQLKPDENNIFSWYATFEGPPDTPFQDGNTLLIITEQ